LNQRIRGLLNVSKLFSFISKAVRPRTHDDLSLFIEQLKPLSCLINIPTRLMPERSLASQIGKAVQLSITSEGKAAKQQEELQTHLSSQKWEA
jgi:hypothetical protein